MHALALTGLARLWRGSLWLATAGLLAMAVLLLSLRLATPWIERHAQPFIHFVLPAGYDVTLDTLRLDWWGWGPDIDIFGLQLQQAGQERLRAERLRVRLDMSASLLERRLVWNRVRLHQGVVSVPEFSAGAPAALPDWLRIEQADLHLAKLVLPELLDGSEWINLSGFLQVGREHLSLALDSTDVRIDGLSHGQNLSFDRLTGTLEWQPQADGWALRTQDLAAVNADLDLRLQGAVSSQSGDLYLDLSADFHIPDVRRIPAYWPREHNPGLRNWLARSLQAGQLNDGRLILRGRAADFPFDASSGEFLLTLHTPDMYLAYPSDWPVIEHLQAELRFHGQSLTIEAEAGRLDDQQLRSTRAVIEDLTAAHLQLNGELVGDLSRLRQSLLKTPLEPQLSAYLTPLQLTGQGLTQLDLQLPLTATATTTAVNGAVFVSQATGRWTEPALTVEQGNGVLEFTTAGVQRGDFTGQFAGHPGRVRLAAERQELEWRLDYGPLQDIRLYQVVDGRVQRITGTLNNPVIAGYALGEVELNGQTNAAAGLQIALSGPRLQGYLTLPAQAEQPLWLALDHLDLVSQQGGHYALNPFALLRPQHLPPIMVTVRDLFWQQRELGQLTVQGQPDDRGYRLVDGQLHHPQHRWQWQGAWRISDTRTETTLQADIDSDSLGELLALFDLGGLERAPMRLSLALRWPGSPFAIGLAELQGELDMNIGEGMLTEIEPGLGRLLGLLNLNSLKRRLQLNFADITRTGLAFDRIKGQFSLHQGQLVTEMLQITGPAARFTITGLLDLQQRRVDQVVTVTPEIGIPLALASTLAAGPVVGAAVVLADQFLKSEFDQAIRYRYALTGTWDAIQVAPITTEARP